MKRQRVRRRCQNPRKNARAQRAANDGDFYSGDKAMNEQAEKAINNIDKIYSTIPDSLRNERLGKHVLDVINEHGEITIALLKRQIEQAVNQSSPKKIDLIRRQDETVLAAIEALLAKPHHR